MKSTKVFPTLYFCMFLTLNILEKAVFISPTSLALYLPELKKTKKTPPKNKNQFMQIFQLSKGNPKAFT